MLNALWSVLLVFFTLNRVGSFAIYVKQLRLAEIFITMRDVNYKFFARKDMCCDTHEMKLDLFIRHYPLI
jgi:hypothetical protein